MWQIVRCTILSEVGWFVICLVYRGFQWSRTICVLLLFLCCLLLLRFGELFSWLITSDISLILELIVLFRVVICTASIFVVSARVEQQSSSLLNRLFGLLYFVQVYWLWVMSDHCCRLQGVVSCGFSLHGRHYILFGMDMPVAVPGESNSVVRRFEGRLTNFDMACFAYIDVLQVLLLFER